jgi:hypothetical protein
VVSERLYDVGDSLDGVGQLVGDHDAQPIQPFHF